MCVHLWTDSDTNIMGQTHKNGDKEREFLAPLIIRPDSYKVCIGKLEGDPWEPIVYSPVWKPAAVEIQKLCFNWNLKAGKAGVLAQVLEVPAWPQHFCSFQVFKLRGTDRSTKGECVLLCLPIQMLISLTSIPTYKPRKMFHQVSGHQKSSLEVAAELSRLLENL